MKIVTPSQTITQYHPLLSNIARKMVGSLAEAEDIVQDTYVKWLSVDPGKIKDTKAYLIKAVTNNCLNHLNRLKNYKMEYFDSLNLGELIDKYFHLDLDQLDLDHEIASALSLLHSKLGPLERAIFILREVFDFDYDQLHTLFDKKQDHCRQILCRAKEKLNRETHILKHDLISANFLNHFHKSCHFGFSSSLLEELKEAVAAKLHFDK